jgi:hypothetical protein
MREAISNTPLPADSIRDSALESGLLQSSVVDMSPLNLADEPCCSDSILGSTCFSKSSPTESDCPFALMTPAVVGEVVGMCYYCLCPRKKRRVGRWMPLSEAAIDEEVLIC